MKPVEIESSIGRDRLATWNEICCAMSVSSLAGFELAGACDNLLDIDSDFSGRACNLTEDDMWLMIINEMPDSKSN